MVTRPTNALSGERGEIIVLQTSLAAARHQGRNVSQNGLSVSQHSVHVLPVSSCKGKVQLAMDGRGRLHHETCFCCDRWDSHTSKMLLSSMTALPLGSAL
jgi:hypothetical protein